MIASTTPASLTVDSLSLDNAIQMTMQNNHFEPSGPDSLAAFETKLLTEVYAKYSHVLYYHKCYNSIKKTKKWVISRLKEHKDNAPDKREYHLYAQSILTNFDIQLLEYQTKMFKSKLELNKVLRTGEHRDHCMSSPFESVYKVLDSAFVESKNNEEQSTLYENMKLYNNQVLLLQQLNIDKHLSEQKLQLRLERFRFDYSELQHYIKESIRTQIQYFSLMLKVRRLYYSIAKKLVRGYR